MRKYRQTHATDAKMEPVPDYREDGSLTNTEIQRSIVIARARLRAAAICLTNNERADAWRWLEAAETAVVVARSGLGDSLA